MQVSVESTQGLERRLSIALDAAKVDAQVDARLKQTASRVRIDGFRQGKVPMSVVRQRFGDDIRNEVVGELMRQSYLEAVQQQALRPAGFPRIEAKVNQTGKAVEFDALVEVYPEFELSDLSQLDIDKNVVDISEDDINEMIVSLRKQRVQYEETQDAAAEGDRVTMDFVGKIDGEIFEGGSAENQNLVLGSKSMIPGFEDELMGIKAGELRDINVSFPDDYRAENLAGKAAVFSVTCHAVAKGVLPELNEEFFGSFGAGEGTEAGFRKEVAANMLREATNNIQQGLKQDIAKAVAAAHPFDLPAALVSEEVRRMQAQFAQQMGKGASVDSLPAEIFAPQAEQRVKSGLVFAKIAEQFEIKLDAAAVDAFLNEVASVYQDPESVVRYYRENSEQMAQVEAAVMENSIVAKVLELAKVTEKQLTYQEAVRMNQSGR